MPLFRRPKPDVTLTALGRPWRSAVEPGLRTGLFPEDEAVPGGSDDIDDEPGTARSRLDPDIVSDLDDFADAVDDLRPGDMSRLYAFWRNVDEEARLSAYERAQAAAEATGRRDVIRSFQDELDTWSLRPEGRVGQTPAELMLLPGDGPMPLTHGRQDVRPALVDTMVALALQDELDDDDFDALFGPWRDAMGDGDGQRAPETDDAGDAGGRAPRRRL